ncbi:hypothetical protein BJY59DRAFT_240529 [Rhodotorula toruloides]
MPAESTVDTVEATQTDAGSAKSHPANEGAESTIVAETLDNIAPTETNGTHDDESTPTADAPAAGEPAETASEDAVNNATVESVGANGTLSAAAEETEEPTEQTDVVIDYDEAFDASAAPATAGENGVEVTSEIATVTSEEMPAPTSPKRSRKFEHEEGLEGADDQASNGKPNGRVLPSPSPSLQPDPLRPGVDRRSPFPLSTSGSTSRPHHNARSYLVDTAIAIPAFISIRAPSHSSRSGICPAYLFRPFAVVGRRRGPCCFPSFVSLPSSSGSSSMRSGRRVSPYPLTRPSPQNSSCGPQTLHAFVLPFRLRHMFQQKVYRCR